MKNYLIKRLLLIIISLWGIITVTFFLGELVPGDAVKLKENMGQLKMGSISKEFLEKTRERLGLNEPIYKRYINTLVNVITLDFKKSLIDERPVMDKIWEALPITITLSVISIFLTYVISIPIGVYSATHQNSISDNIITIILFILYSLPSFWVALLLIQFFGSYEYLDIFPIVGIASDGADNLSGFERFVDVLWHLVLPVTCYTYGSLAGLSRYARAGMLEVIRQDYITTARAKGLSERVVIFKHAFRNSLIPIVTLMATLLPSLIGGSVIIENIFGIPGMGKLSFDAMKSLDIPTIIGVTTLTGILTLVGILLSDLMYVLVDPRIKLEKAK